jgi:hypothetical protein
MQCPKPLDKRDLDSISILNNIVKEVDQSAKHYESKDVENTPFDSPFTILLESIRVSLYLHSWMSLRVIYTYHKIRTNSSAS